MISHKDRQVLRELARHQLSLSKSERNQKLVKDWYRHHRLENGRPMVHIELWTFEQELIPKRLRCETELGRQIETDIYRQIINFEVFGDDRPVPDYYPVTWDTHFDLFDIKIILDHPEGDSASDLGHQFVHQITDLNKDYEGLKPSTYGVNRQKTMDYQAIVEDVIGDILEVRLVMNALTACPTQDIVHIMGMQNMFMSMIDTPELFKAMMHRVAEDYISYFRWLETQRLILPTTGYENLGNGSFCFDETLISNNESLASSQVWGFMDSQETVGISPDMFGEFIVPTYEKIAKEFAQLSYGCCEPVDGLWDEHLSKLSNMKKVSISPWCNEQIMGEKLVDSGIIYFRKPSPNYLGVGKNFDEIAFRQHIKDTVTAARGCQVEFAQRDVYTINNDERKIIRAVEIIREETTFSG